MSIKGYYEEINKETRVYEYASNNFSNFINFENEIIKNLNNKKILFVKSKIEVEYIEKESKEDDFY